MVDARTGKVWADPVWIRLKNSSDMVVNFLTCQYLLTSLGSLAEDPGEG